MDDISRRRGSDPRILVVGAGIGGLGAARALALRGISVDVVEREPTWAEAGAGIYLPGNAVRALRALGLESAVTERAAPIPRQLIYDHRGRLLSQIDLAPLWGDVGACVALHRADLHQVLWSGGEGVTVRMGMPVRRLRQDGEAVRVEFGDGTIGDYELVIGADGTHSTVRDLTFGAGAVRPLGQRAWRFVTRCPSEVKTWTAMLGREMTFLAVPIGRGRVYCYCDVPASVNTHGDGGAATGDVAKLLAKLLADFAGPVPAVLDSLGPEIAVHAGPIEEVVLSGWSRGSVLLIGDAAHATSPNMAEGAAMALEDGLVLAECLASEQPVSRALTSFEARRAPRTRWVRAQTHRRDRTRSLPPMVRDLVLRRWGRQIFHHNYRPLRDVP
jgi:2-polyprenyl-6-methoxyphenol hydroxylase-like FAD-dependent oxidoreductase